MRWVQIGAISAIVGLAGCQEQRTVVLEQSSAANMASNVAPNGGVYQPAPRPRPVLSPCTPPIGTGPFEQLPKPVSGAPVHKPARMLAEQRPGCVGVRFRLAPDGTPRDVEALTEYPSGYGMGSFGVAAISATRWPAKDDYAWRYFIITLRPGGPANPG